MENTLPKSTSRTCIKKPTVTIAAEHADIVIADISYRIWLEADEPYL